MFGGGFSPTVYYVLRLDRVQAHAYIVQEAGVDLEKRVDLLPSKFRAEDHVLQARGEWQLLPHQPSIVPHSWEAMVCQRCHAQSSRPPCVICFGASDSAHGLIIGGELRLTQGVSTPSLVITHVGTPSLVITCVHTSLPWLSRT